MFFNKESDNGRRITVVVYGIYYVMKYTELLKLEAIVFQSVFKTTTSRRHRRLWPARNEVA